MYTTVDTNRLYITRELHQEIKYNRQSTYNKKTARRNQTRDTKQIAPKISETSIKRN